MLENSSFINGVIHIFAVTVKGGVVITFCLEDEKYIETLAPIKCGKHLELCSFADRIYVLAIVGEEIFIWSLEKDKKKTTFFTLNNITKFPTLGSVIVKELV